MFNDVRATVAADFEAVDQFILSQLHSRVSLVENIGEYIVSAGGKRLRPIMVLLAARACGQANEDVIRLAAVIEFIHTATLLHDDVVDMSSMRRGRPTANEEWNSPSSVLVGDFIYSRAFQILVNLGNMEIMRIVADTTNLIAEGEVRQLLNRNRADTSEAEYMQVIREKTAILFQAATECGAILAGANDEQRAALREAGLRIGMAFQLIDDALDYSGCSETMGKNIGDDLAEGKPTLPLIHAMQQAGTSEAQMIRTSIEQGSSQDLDPIIAIVRESGALEYTRQCARREAEAARAAIAGLPRSNYRSALDRIARLAVDRTT